MAKSSGADKSHVVVPQPAGSKSSPVSSSEAVNQPRHAKTSSTKPDEPASISTLSICRNKHWRFISAFHGPWLQLPHELLESLALGNHVSPRPHVIDPGLFFDIVQIRRLVDEATNLSVRAVNGTSSSALSTSLNAGHGQRGGGGGTTKLSGERRYRMRELAVKKLSEAYHLDEIATSVATMQSASSLEDVAKMVLQRAPSNPHAKYVHFFHEKIPSRALAESTSLQSLNEILQGAPDDSAVFRTRAVTRIFKEDFAGAAKDLTEALTCLRRAAPQRRDRAESNDPDIGGQEADTNSQVSKYHTQNPAKEAKPTGLEAHLYFQRAEVYLSSAYQSIEKALQCKPNGTNERTEAQGDGLEAYRKVKLNAKRSLRDFTTFLSKLEYSPGISAAAGDSVITTTNNSAAQNTASLSKVSLSEESGPGLSNEKSSGLAMVQKTHPQSRTNKVYQVSDLFSPTPPRDLPPFPAVSSVLVKANACDGHVKPGASSPCEMVSYHPLMTEALHGLLLCHTMLQTEVSQIQRHAYAAARLITLCDGFPVFIDARSASRADWVDVLNQTRSWLNLSQPWDELCKSASPSKQARMQDQLSNLRPKDLQNLGSSIGLPALQNAVTSKTVQSTSDIVKKQQTAGDNTVREGNKPRPASTPQSKADFKAYALLTERADMITRWVLEAPVLDDAPAKPKKGKKKGPRASPLAS